jgi:response regulator RpfG family c-di-GMP phosphodiesterase
LAMREIVEELRKGSGTQFDPLVIKAFLKTLK